MIIVGFDFADFAGPLGKKGIRRTNQLCRCGGAEGEAEGFKEGRVLGSFLSGGKTWLRHSRKIVEKESVTARGPG